MGVRLSKATLWRFGIPPSGGIWENKVRLKGGTPNKSPNQLSWRRWFGPGKPLMFSGSADKHLLVSVTAVNWARRRRHEHFQTAAQAGQNCRQLARGLYYFSLNELSGVNHAFMGRIDRAADQMHFLMGHL